jgi:hypothetical protein
VNPDSSATDNLLTFPKDGATMNMQGDGLVKITDESIKRIPIVESDVLPEQYWEKLRDEQRDLLRFVQSDEPGTEAIAYYTMDMRRLTRYKGIPGAGEVFPMRYDVPHIIIHTHPDGMTFSLNDFVPFMENPMTEIMCAVGNNGIIYTFEKLPGFEAANAAREFISAQKNAPYYKDDYKGYVNFADNFYTSIQNYGFKYRIG